MTDETAPPPDPAGPKRPAPAIPFTNGQLNALSDRRARAIVEMLMPKANRALKLQGKRVVIVGLEAGLGRGAEGSLKSAVTALTRPPCPPLQNGAYCQFFGLKKQARVAYLPHIAVRHCKMLEWGIVHRPRGMRARSERKNPFCSDAP